jgi:Fe-S oxidoreductase
MAPQRRIPAFAPQTFKDWFRRRGPRNRGRPPVILWPDTFNNHFFPQTLAAAVEVLENAGVQVTVPEKDLCCGRPLYDFGMLKLAKHQLRQILDALRPDIEAGVPVIGLEPSCVSVFRDELHNLFPTDLDAQRLRHQTVTLGEYLSNRDSGYQPPTLHRKALVHGHCHHKAIMGLGGEDKLLHALGLDYEVLQSGCCGMAGSFGFEDGKYDLSRAIGERVLLPAVRNADADTLIIADGFSCREQIAQETERRALHLAEVVQLALHSNGEQARARRPELDVQRLAPRALARPSVSPLALVAVGGGIAVAGSLLARRLARKQVAASAVAGRRADEEQTARKQ